MYTHQDVCIIWSAIQQTLYVMLFNKMCASCICFINKSQERGHKKHWVHMYPVTGMRSGFLEASFVPADCWVRIFRWDRMALFTYGLFLYMGSFTESPVTCSFILKYDYPFGRTPIDIIICWIITPLQLPLLGITRDLKNFKLLDCLVCFPDQNSILQELGYL